MIPTPLWEGPDASSVRGLSIEQRQIPSASPHNPGPSTGSGHLRLWARCHTPIQCDRSTGPSKPRPYGRSRSNPSSAAAVPNHSITSRWYGMPSSLRLFVSSNSDNPG